MFMYSLIKVIKYQKYIFTKLSYEKRSNKANIRKHIMSHEDETNCPVEFCLFIKKNAQMMVLPF